MERSLNKLRLLVHELDGSGGRLAGGFGTLRGGTAAMVEAPNQKCTNDGKPCTNTNYGGCTNTVCEKTTDINCTNTFSC